MSPSRRTRKPVDQLTPEDLVDFPIWEFADDEEGVDGQDETWVRPHARKVVGKDLYSLSVAADFVAASGRVLAGLVGVTTAGAFEVGHGALLHAGRYIFVPSAEYPGATEERRAVAGALGMSEAEVFPLKYTLRVLLKGESALRRGVFD